MKTLSRSTCAQRLSAPLALAGLLAGCGAAPGTGADDLGSGGTGNQGNRGGTGSVAGSGGDVTGGTSGSGNTGTGGTTGGTGGASGAGGTTGGAGGAAGSAGSGGTMPNVDFDYDPPAEVIETCVEEHVRAEPSPVDMYIIIDRSGSMDTSSKWKNARKALNAFFVDPAMSGMGVALSYFESERVGCGPLSTPDVARGILPGHANTLTSVLNSWGTLGGTAVEEAIRGIVTYTKSAAAKYSNRLQVGILITDGEPTECNTRLSTLASLFASHYQSTGIASYVVGMTGADMSALGTLAAGAAPSPLNRTHDVGTGNGNVLVNVLKEIQKATVACSFQLPQAEGVDYTGSKVLYTSGGGAQKTLPQRSKTTCGSSEGWYYDNPVTPTRFLLCPTSCDQMKADANAKVDIEIACSGG